MPYILKEDRPLLDAGSTPLTPGELNYLLTMTCIKYLESRGESYQTYNNIIGALECAKLEMYRRSIAPYEDKKIQENGDVYV